MGLDVLLRSTCHRYDSRLVLTSTLGAGLFGSLQWYGLLTPHGIYYRRDGLSGLPAQRQICRVSRQVVCI